MQALTKTDLSKFYFGSFAVMDLGGVPCFVTRTGYTGEDGFEISIPNERALEFTQKLMAGGSVHLSGAWLALPLLVCGGVALLVHAGGRMTRASPTLFRCVLLQASARATACAWRLGCACTATIWMRPSRRWRLAWRGPSVRAYVRACVIFGSSSREAAGEVATPAHA
jgi:hypothetical protein